MHRFITRRINQYLEVEPDQLIHNHHTIYTETVKQLRWRCSVCHHEAWVDEGGTLQCCKPANQRG